MWKPEADVSKTNVPREAHQLGHRHFLNSVTQLERDQNPTDAGTEQIKTVLIVLRFKGQSSADAVRKQLKDLGKKIGTNLQPVHTSPKIGDKSMRCLHFNMWSVWCWLYWLYQEPSLSTHWADLNVFGFKKCQGKIWIV